MTGARDDDPITELPTDPIREAKDRDWQDPSDMDLDLAELRDGGPTRTPGMRTTTGGTAGPASVAGAKREHRRPGPGADESGKVAPTTTGDATSGGMETPVRSSTSDATTGPAEAGDFTDR